MMPTDMSMCLESWEDLEVSGVTQNNLGGLAGACLSGFTEEVECTASGEVVRATLSGMNVDVVLTATSTYETSQSCDDCSASFQNEFLVLNVRTGTYVDLNIAFVDRDTDEPVAMDGIYFSLVEFGTNVVPRRPRTNTWEAMPCVRCMTRERKSPSLVGGGAGRVHVRRYRGRSVLRRRRRRGDVRVVELRRVGRVLRDLQRHRAR